MRLQTFTSQVYGYSRPPGTITWRARSLESTIGLTFVSAALTPRVITCQPADHWEQSSDHRPILTHLDLATTEGTPRPRRAWQRTDTPKLRATFREAMAGQPWPHLGTTEGLDQAAEIITLAIRTAVEAATPWAQPSTRA